MTKVFEALDFSQVGHFQALLEDAGVETTVKNQFTTIVTGRFPQKGVWPELWVLNDEDVAHAKEILDAYRKSDGSDIGPAWDCRECNEHVSGEFDECWNCQTARPAASTK